MTDLIAKKIHIPSHIFPLCNALVEDQVEVGDRVTITAGGPEYLVRTIGRSEHAPNTTYIFINAWRKGVR